MTVITQPYTECGNVGAQKPYLFDMLKEPGDILRVDIRRIPTPHPLYCCLLRFQKKKALKNETWNFTLREDDKFYIVERTE